MYVNAECSPLLLETSWVLVVRRGLNVIVGLFSSIGPSKFCVSIQFDLFRGHFLVSIIRYSSLRTSSAMGTLTAILVFTIVALVCIVHTVFEQHPTISTNHVSGGDHFAHATKNGNVLQLRKSSHEKGYLSGRQRSLKDSGHPVPHHSTVHIEHNATLHKKAWMHYEEVDGLKNEEVVMFVMSSTVKDGYLLRERFVNFSKYAF